MAFDQALYSSSVFFGIEKEGKAVENPKAVSGIFQYQKNRARV